MNMVTVHVIVEGQTEEKFIKEMLFPHLITMGIRIRPTLIGKPGKKGGAVNWLRLWNDIKYLYHFDPDGYVTTFFDFYGRGYGFPEIDPIIITDIKEKKERIEKWMMGQVAHSHLSEEQVKRFIPYVQMYEFEGLLFSAPKKFAQGISLPEIEPQLTRIRSEFKTPEHINDNIKTAPSKRIIHLVGGYRKTIQGILGAKEIGLPLMRQECAFFNGWLEKIEGIEL